MATTKTTKYIFVTGGVLSGLGKGITAASIGTVLKSRGLSVNIQKLDPYLNVDAGTLNPAEHGECFVTADGAETDLDLGHYERFLDIDLTQKSSVMSGRILRRLIDDERAGKYLGKTVQVVPHFTKAIQEAILEASEGFDVHIAEVGGTVGDYESPAFFEAIREMANTVGRENCVYVNVVYMPYLGTSKEIKTKPAQNASRDLRALGINPDVLAARSEMPAPDSVKAKLASFCGVPEEGIVLLPNAESVYEVPLTIEASGVADHILKRLSIDAPEANLTDWRDMVTAAKTKFDTKLCVGVVAKYMDNVDTYMSVFEALKAAAWSNDAQLDIKWIDAEALEADKDYSVFDDVDGIVVPGGFGERALEGKILAAQHAIQSNIPYLGLCLGMQMGAVAFARLNGVPAATSLELDESAGDPVIHIMESQRGVTDKGGTMRLGNYECVLQPGSKGRELYGVDTVHERHRHRFEFNNAYRDQLESAGMVMSGVSPDGELVELIELADHRFFMGSQYHPELKSRPSKPHPLFVGFMAELAK